MRIIRSLMSVLLCLAPDFACLAPGLACLALVATTVAFTNTAAAQTPSTLQVEGVVRATGGGPAPDGDYLLSFSLWDAQKDGKSLWSEAPAAVKVSGGAFSRVLGTVAKLKPENFAKAAWLQLKIGTDGPMPRIQLRAVPWALRAVVAGGVDCVGCIKGSHIAGGSVAPSAVGFAYAAAADGIKGGAAKSAKLANDLQCTGCVSATKEVKWDGDIDLGAAALKAAKVTVTGSLVVGGVVSASQFQGDGSKLTGIKTAAGNCSKAGEVVKGIKADGSLICVAALDPKALPADGLDEISNGLLSNQFIDEKAIAKPVPISDNNPQGVTSVIEFPDVGLAQKLWISADITNSDITAVAITLKDPAGKVYTLKKKGTGKKGDGIKTSWPDPTKPESGDLSTWLGKNPKGKWTLTVMDTLFLDNKVDGAIKTWSVKIQTLSNQKVAIKGKIMGGMQLKNSDTDPVPCNAANAGYMYFSPKYKLMRVCNGEQYYPVALTVVGSGGSPGVNCKHILTLLPTAKSGLYFIDPDGAGGLAKLQVYCDMDTLGGGWTLVLHTFYSGKTPPSAAYKQKFASWESKGIGIASGYAGLQSKSNYFMALKWWKSLSSGASELRIQGESAVNAGTIKDYKMNAKYGLDGSNEGEIAKNFCSGSKNCFIYAPGFSALDKDNDSHGPKCADSYGNSGWWYAHCFHYNPHHQTDKQHFAGYVKADPSSSYWTWWLR